MEVKEFINGPVVYDSDGQYFWIQDQVRKGNQMLAELRGWGAINALFLPDLKEAADFQDKVGQWIADAINDKLNREASQFAPERPSDEEIENACTAYSIKHNITEGVIIGSIAIGMKAMRDRIFNGSLLKNS